METKNSPKLAKTRQDFFCEKCNYTCSKQSDFTKHLTTRKHALSHVGNTWKQMETKKLATPEFRCACGKSYVTRTGLWKHQKLAKSRLHENPENYALCFSGFDNESETEIDNNLDAKTTPQISVPTHHNDQSYTHMPSPNTMNKDEIIMELLQQNKELQMRVLEISTTANVTTNSHNIQNSHNKTFNLQFFLNETCKDAMNITDFVNSLKLTLTDLEKVGELGYAEGISRMFMRGLSELDVTRRPIHCSDLKREVIHIKDHDKWERDTDNQDKLREAIKNLSSKNIMLLDDWQRQNPGCTNYDNNKNELYLKIQCESMGPGSNKEEKRDFSKIVRAVAKHTIIQKTLGCSD